MQELFLGQENIMAFILLRLDIFVHVFMLSFYQYEIHKSAAHTVLQFRLNKADAALNISLLLNSHLTKCWFCNT